MSALSRSRIYLLSAGSSQKSSGLSPGTAKLSSSADTCLRDVAADAVIPATSSAEETVQNLMLARYVE